MDNSKFVEAIAKEISEDPEKRGYAGKSREEIRDLLNEPYEVEEVIVNKVRRPARINQILLGIAEMPNVATLVDVDNVLKK